jgi:hypothetical protein
MVFRVQILVGTADMRSAHEKVVATCFALASTAGDLAKCFKGWGGRRESNPQRPEPQSGALPVELLPPCTCDYNNLDRLP